MADPISTALVAWATKKLAETASAMAQERRMRDNDAPDVRRALISVVRSGVADALARTFPNDEAQQQQIQLLLFHKEKGKLPLVDGSYPEDLPARVRDWVSWIESPPQEDGSLELVEEDHQFVLALCVGILEQLRRAATRGTRVLAAIWHDFKAEADISHAGTQPAQNEYQIPWDRCYQPRYWTNQEHTINQVCNHLRSADRSPILISGSCGSGKTTLAGVIALREKDLFPDGVLYLELENQSANEGIRYAMERLGWSHLPVSSSRLSQLYLSVLASKRMLLIIDEPHSLSEVEALWPRTTLASFVVLTSRPLRWREAVHFDIPPLELEHAIAMVESAENVDHYTADRLVQSLGGHPGNLLHAANHLSNQGSAVVNIADLINETSIFSNSPVSISERATTLLHILNRFPVPVFDRPFLESFNDIADCSQALTELEQSRLIIQTGPNEWSLQPRRLHQLTEEA